LGYFFIINGPSSELSSRLASWHNQGSIILYVDGKETTLNDIPVSLEIEGIVEESVIRHGKFLFQKGEYGRNSVRFTIPAALYEGVYDIPITAEYTNFNNWHVNLYLMNITVDTQSATVKIEGHVYTATDIAFHPFNSTIVPLDGSEITVKAYGG